MNILNSIYITAARSRIEKLKREINLRNIEIHKIKKGIKDAEIKYKVK